MAKLILLLSKKHDSLSNFQCPASRRIELPMSFRLSGNVEFYLKLYNAKHPFTLPSQYDLNVLAISSSWQEGVGLDMEEYKDLTYDQLGSNWIKRSGSTSWNSEGGDFHASPVYSQHRSQLEMKILEINVTSLVEEWLDGTKDNYGFAIKLPDASRNRTDIILHKKSSFARGTGDWFRRPVLEARWDSTIKDDRGNFYTSSSLAPAADNLEHNLSL